MSILWAFIPNSLWSASFFLFSCTFIAFIAPFFYC
jgi:hypothetical protein